MGRAANVEEVINDVSKHFEHPSDIVMDRTYSREDKIELLRHWDHDLRLLMVATEENMPGPTPGSSAELMGEVKAALEALGADSSEGTNASKLG